MIHLRNVVWFVFCILCSGKVWAIPGYAHGLFLALHLGITPDFGGHMGYQGSNSGQLYARLALYLLYYLTKITVCILQMK